MLEINKIYCMDCLEGMKQLDDNSIDAIITDPPYEINFMCKKWDSTGIAYNIGVWKECYRILKPGGHLLSFGGSRTYHRMACAVEDTGFEIRDMINWVYGSGFPKSLDISKAIDKRGGKTIGWFGEWLRKYRTEKGISQKEICELGGFYDKVNHGGMVTNWELGYNLPTVEQFNRICEILHLPFVKMEEAEREIVGKGTSGKTAIWQEQGGMGDFDLTIPSSSEAKEWDGWGTALKPAHEPIVLARKTLSEKTVAENVLRWGVGGLNIDECRIPLDGEPNPTGSAKRVFKSNQYTDDKIYGDNTTTSNLGRFPANFIHDGSDEVEVEFAKAGILRSGDNCIRQKEGYFFEHGGLGKKGDIQITYGDVGSASRFFYCAKASKEEREMGLEGMPPAKENLQGLDTRGRTLEREDGSKTLVERWQPDRTRVNNHPTVKPIDLIKYLVKLVTKEKQLVLDPFIGSGTTALACMVTNRNFIGFEISQEYCDIAQRRIQSPIIQTEIQENKIKRISIDGWI